MLLKYVKLPNTYAHLKFMLLKRIPICVTDIITLVSSLITINICTCTYGTSYSMHIKSQKKNFNIITVLI